jgi:hypothetical protein
VHDDLAAVHAHPLPGIDAAEPGSRRPADHERAAAHARSGPIAGVALDVQLPAAHAGPGVHPDIAGDGEPPGGHARADVLHAAQVALHAHVVAGAGDREELAHARALVAMPERQRRDVVRAGEPVGRENFGLQWHLWLGAQREGERHGTSSRRWMWNGPRLPP